AGPGRRAGRMPQLPGPLRRERAARLRAVGDAAKHRFLASRRGRLASVLVEKAAEGRGWGHSEHFAPVRLEGVATPGTIVSARILEVSGDELIGRAVAA